MNRLKTRLFDFGIPMAQLAEMLDVSVSEVYRIKQGKRGIHEKVIVGALRAFPGKTFEELFYVTTLISSPTSSIPSS